MPLGIRIKKRIKIRIPWAFSTLEMEAYHRPAASE